MNNLYIKATDKRDGKVSWVQMPKGWTEEQFRSDMKRAYPWFELGETKIREFKEENKCIKT